MACPDKGKIQEGKDMPISHEKHAQRDVYNDYFRWKLPHSLTLGSI